MNSEHLQPQPFLNVLILLNIKALEQPVQDFCELGDKGFQSPKPIGL